MSNKLEELTRKLYDEGLMQGKSDAEKLLSDAKTKADRIVAEAMEKAAEIENQAVRKSEEISRNAMTELSLAGKQAIASLRSSIETTISGKCIDPAVHAANLDADFLKGMLLRVAENWNGSKGGKVQLSALLPEESRAELDKRLSGSIGDLLSKGIEVGYSDKVRSGFTVGEKDGGYMISFSDDDFSALLKEYLKEKTVDLLYK